jgi:hypothetical protein
VWKVLSSRCPTRIRWQSPPPLFTENPENFDCFERNGCPEELVGVVCGYRCPLSAQPAPSTPPAPAPLLASRGIKIEMGSPSTKAGKGGARRRHGRKAPQQLLRVPGSSAAMREHKKQASSSSGTACETAVRRVFTWTWLPKPWMGARSWRRCSPVHLPCPRDK